MLRIETLLQLINASFETCLTVSAIDNQDVFQLKNFQKVNLDYFSNYKHFNNSGMVYSTIPFELLAYYAES